MILVTRSKHIPNQTYNMRDQLICQQYVAGASQTELSHEFSLTKGRISTILKKYSIQTRRVDYLDHGLILQLYSSGMTANAISKRLGCNRRSIDHVITSKGNKRTIRELIATYDIDVSFFRNIDCEVKAYWFGFLLADGSLPHRQDRNGVGQRPLQISLAIKDISHLERFRSHLKSTHPIKIRPGNKGKTRNAVFRVVCAELSRDLLIHGWDAFKLHGAWPEIGGDLEIHVVRGMIDGDGWVSRSKRRGIIYPEIGLCNEFQEPLYESLRILNISANLLKAYSKTSKKYIWKWRKRGSTILDVYHMLYDHATIWLPRKRIYLESMI